MWTAKQQRRERETWVQDCEDAREEESVGQEAKSWGPRPSLPSLTWVREGDVAGCRDDVNKHSEEGETVAYVVPFSSHNNRIWAPAPMPADNPKCSPSAPSKRITSYGEDHREVPRSRDAGLEFQHVFVKELKKRKKNLSMSFVLVSWLGMCVWQ